MTYNPSAVMVTALHRSWIQFCKKENQLSKMHLNEIENTDGVEEENKFRAFI